MPRPDTDPKWIKGKVDRIALDEGCYFDQDEADYAVDFIESFCTIYKSKHAGKTIKLSPWQLDLVTRLFGWRRADGTRRYRTAYVEIPKKNGKSLVLAAIAIYMAIADGEAGAEVYLAAVTGKQARDTLFDVVSNIIKSNKTLLKRVDMVDSKNVIKIPGTFSKIQIVMSDAEARDGLDSSCTIFDELHRAKNRKLWDVFEFAGRGRDQPLLLSITTAGNDRNSVCWEQHEYSRKVEQGEVLDTTHLAVIYAADPHDDFSDPATWHKANPSLGHTLRLDDFKQDLEKAKESPSGWNNFLRLRFNIWTQSSTSYIKHEHWARGNRTPEEWKTIVGNLEGQPCFGGMDISSKLDITAFVLLFGDPDNGLTVVPKFWIPEATAKDREVSDGIKYRQWAREGFITIIPGAVIDYDLVEAEIRGLAKQYKIKSFTSDDWGGSEAVGQRLKSAGIKPNFMRQGFRSMSEPTKELERLMIMGKVIHGGNPVLEWMNSNAIVKSDPAGNIKVEKPSKDSAFKVDGIIAMIEAFYGLQLTRKTTNAYSTRKTLLSG